MNQENLNAYFYPVDVFDHSSMWYQQGPDTPLEQN